MKFIFSNLAVGNEYIVFQEECFLVSRLGGKAFRTVKLSCKSAPHISSATAFL